MLICNSYIVYRANESAKRIPTVFLLPDPSELTTTGPLYIHTDASKFLQVNIYKIKCYDSKTILISTNYTQFVLKPANASQASYHEVTEVYSLTTLIQNPRRAQLSLCHLALPQVIEWPSYQYYTYKGEYLKQPQHWYTPPPVAYTEAEFDFSAKSPVKPFKPRRIP